MSNENARGGKPGKTGVLLVNLGTPDSPAPGDVRRYLLEFLTDGRVIDYPWLPRNLLVRGIIVPFRYKKSAKTYSAIWDADRGSPLLYHSQDLLREVRALLPENHIAELAMRYQNPSIAKGLRSLRDQGVDEIVVFPLFPQYASSTTGSVHEAVMAEVITWQAIPAIRFVADYFDHPGFIDAFAERIAAYGPENYDHVLFSYHGLPERHLRKADPTGKHCLAPDHSCCNSLGLENRFCYRAQCAATTRALAGALGLRAGSYTICFQSRLGKDPWIRPYTSDVLEELAGKGVKKILVACPAFVADCLETIFEIGVEYQEEFEALGGEHVQLVESLNASPKWARAVCDIVLGSGK